MLTRTEKKFPKDIVGLTSLRFYAVFYVILFHYHFLFSPAVDLILSKGYLAVDFFFILSGFILAHCYLSTLENKTFTYRHFLIKRIAPTPQPVKSAPTPQQTKTPQQQATRAAPTPQQQQIKTPQQQAKAEVKPDKTNNSSVATKKRTAAKRDEDDEDFDLRLGKLNDIDNDSDLEKEFEDDLKNLEFYTNMRSPANK